MRGKSTVVSPKMESFSISGENKYLLQKKRTDRNLQSWFYRSHPKVAASLEKEECLGFVQCSEILFNS